MNIVKGATDGKLFIGVQSRIFIVRDLITIYETAHYSEGSLLRNFQVIPRNLKKLGKNGSEGSLTLPRFIAPNVHYSLVRLGTS